MLLMTPVGNFADTGNTFAPVSAIGLVEGILVLPNGNLQGGADSRGDDTVSAY